MNTPAKDQILQLAPEQQATIAKMEVTRLKKRQKLLACARSSRTILIVASIMPNAVIVGVIIYAKPPPQHVLISLAICIWSLFLFIFINRRLDAIMQLLEDDKIISDGIADDETR